MARGQPNKSFVGRVVGVVDGDTLDVLRHDAKVRIRVAEIDCPENGQAFSGHAKRVASRLAFGKTVRVTVTGHADTRPRASNDTSEDRAKNRRVDISIVRGAELDQQRHMSISEAAIPELVSEESTS